MSLTATLDAIGLKHGTDKASSHHNYLDFYEFFFAPLREAHLTVLEVGVLDGASLRTWEDYFPHAKIIGADISSQTKQFEQGRVFVELLDQSNVEELTQLGIKHGPFDLIVEDGSHMWEHQITSLRTLFPFLNENGVYIVEDLQTNYGTMQERYKGNASATCVDYLKAWVDLCVADDSIPITEVEDAFLRTYGRAVESISFYRRACLIKKRFPTLVREIGPGEPLAASPTERALIPVRIVAHVSNKGDVLGATGFVNLGSDSFGIQGLAIDCGGAPLEYRVRRPDGSWSDWAHGNKFVGTRGQAETLTGFTVRLQSEAREQYALRAIGRFVGAVETVQVSDGRDCVSPSGGQLCGIQIELFGRVG
jgi:hypothetical protein